MLCLRRNTPKRGAACAGQHLGLHTFYTAVNHASKPVSKNNNHVKRLRCAVERQALASYTAAQQHQEFPEGTMNRNIRDVLAHLHHWHLLMLEWYRLGMTGEKPAMPATGYSWKMTPARPSLQKL